jgi:hypothetical protein
VLEIRPELQQLRVGETIVTHGRSGFGPPVTRIEPGRSLVLGGPRNEKGSQSTWAFHLLDGPDGTTRLLERGRGLAGKGLQEKLGFGPYLIDPIGFVMSKKMLRTIKRLAEISPARGRTHRFSSSRIGISHLAAQEPSRELGDRFAGLPQREAVLAPQPEEGLETGEHVQRSVARISLIPGAQSPCLGPPPRPQPFAERRR